MAFRAKVISQAILGFEFRMGLYCDSCGKEITSMNNANIIFDVNFGEAIQGETYPILICHKGECDNNHKDKAWNSLCTLFDTINKIKHQLIKKG